MRENKLDSIGQMLEEAIDKSKNLKEGILKAEWGKIVGRLVERSQPEYIKDGILVVTVEGPVFIHYFAGNKEEYIEKINKYFDSDLIKDIEIKSGKLSETRNEYLNRDIEPEDYEDKKKPVEYDEEKYIPKNEDDEEELDIEFDHEEYREDEFDKEFEAEQKELENKSHTFDMSMEGMIKRIKYLQELSEEREKYLLANGYKKCRGCGVIFEPTEEEKEDFCKVCITAKKDRKMRNNNI